jgi:hypothetical protein
MQAGNFTIRLHANTHINADIEYMGNLVRIDRPLALSHLQQMMQFSVAWRVSIEAHALNSRASMRTVITSGVVQARLNFAFLHFV